MAKKYIDVMDTTFRDGFQSVFGGRVLMDDFFPAVDRITSYNVCYTKLLRIAHDETISIDDIPKNIDKLDLNDPENIIEWIEKNAKRV